MSLVKKKILSVLTIIALSLPVFVFPTITVSATTITETCALPCIEHELQHSFSKFNGSMITLANVGTKVYCDTCGLAYVAIERFTPPGAPSGYLAPRAVYYNLNKGVSTEKCTDSHCTGTGPHYKCACGKILTSEDQPHNRTYVSAPGIKWKDYTESNYPHTLTKGTHIRYVAGGDANVRPITFVVNGTTYTPPGNPNISEYLFTMPEDGTFYVDANNWLLAGGNQSGSYAYERSPTYSIHVLDTVDSEGTKWNIPLVKGVGSQIDTSATYTDGISCYGGYCETDAATGALELQSTYGGYRAHAWRIQATLEVNQRVVMHIKGSSGSYADYSKLVLTDLDGYPVVSSSVLKQARKTTYDTYIELYAPSAGDYYIVPLHYNTEDSAAYWESTAGKVTIYTDNLITPSQQAQSISASISNNNIQYGSGAPALSVNNAQTTLSYVSSNPAVATINSAGVIEIKGLGSTTFIVSAEETNAWKAAQDTVTLTVSKGNLSVSAKPTAGSINYGQQLSASDLSGGKATNASGSVVGGVWSFKSPSTYPNAGTTAYTVRFIPTDTVNYNY